MHVRLGLLAITRALKTPNGFAWVLFKDALSVEKSIKLYNDGHAAIYGSPFIISPITADFEESEAGSGNIEADLAARAAAEASRKAQERSDIDEAHAKSLDKQKNQKAAYGGSVCLCLSVFAASVCVVYWRVSYAMAGHGNVPLEHTRRTELCQDV